MDLTIEEATILALQSQQRQEISTETSDGMQKSLKHLHMFIASIPQTLTHLNTPKDDQIQTFSLGLLERLMYSSISLVKVFDSIVLEPQVSFSAGLTMRALILDYLIVLKVTQVELDAKDLGKSTTEINEIIKEWCGKFLADGLENSFEYFEKMKALNVIDQKDLENIFNNLAREKSEFIEPHQGDGSKPIVKTKYNKAPGAYAIFKQLVCTPLLKNSAFMYDIYNHYSKYDHFGTLYFDSVTQKLDKEISRLNRCVVELLRHYALLYAMLLDAIPKDVFINEQMNNATKYYKANVPLV